MGLREYFGRKPDPSKENLQRVGEQKNKKTKEIVLPPRDNNGRFVSDRPKVKGPSAKSVPRRK